MFFLGEGWKKEKGGEGKGGDRKVERDYYAVLKIPLKSAVPGLSLTLKPIDASCLLLYVCVCKFDDSHDTAVFLQQLFFK